MLTTPAATGDDVQLEVGAHHQPFQITYAPKPLGTPGRKPPRGYNLQEVLQMIREEYLFFLHMVHVILASTKGIDMRKTIDKQQPRGIISLILREADEFEVFRADAYWPIRAFIQVSLKSSNEKFKRLHRSLALRSSSSDSTPPSNDSSGPANGPTGALGHDLTIDDPAESVPEAADSQVNTVPPIEVTVEIEVEAAINYAALPDNTENDNDTDLLINELSNMSIDPTADDNALDEPPAPILSFLQEMPSQAMETPIAVNTGITQLAQLQGAVQSLAQLPDWERAQLPIGIQQLFSLFGNPSGPLGPISTIAAASSPPFVQVPNTTLAFGGLSGPLGHISTFATASPPSFVHIPNPALASGSSSGSLGPVSAFATTSPPPFVHAPNSALALAPAPSLAPAPLPAPAPTPAPTTTHTAHARASTQATQTLTAPPALPDPSAGTTTGMPQLKPVHREGPSAKSQPLLTELFDDDGILSDASSATSPNENESSQAKPTTANAKTVAHNTRSTTGATRGRGAGRGVGRGGGSTGGAILEPAGGAGRGGRGGRRGTTTNASASATSRGKGKGKAVDNLDEFDKAPVVHASGSRRARKV